MKSLISACMIVKDEESFIKESIASVLPYVEEVIVVDTGSKDATVSIASHMGAKTIETPWQGDFSKARNTAIQHSSRPIVLMIDADERLERRTVHALHDAARFLDENKSKAARIRIRNYTDDANTSISYVTRMFPNNGKFKYTGRIHEQLCEEGNVPESIDTDIEFNHFGYMQEVIDQKQKLTRNIELLRKEASENEDNSYITYQLGKTYAVQKEYAEAEAYLRQAYQIASRDSHYCLPNIIYSLCHVLLQVKKYSDFGSIIDEAITLYPDYTDLYFTKGRAIVDNLDITQFHLVPQLFERCVELGEVSNTQYESHVGVGTFKALYNLGIYYEMAGHKQQAIQCYERSWEFGFKPAMERLHLLR